MKLKQFLRRHSSIWLQIKVCAPSHPPRFNRMDWKQYISAINTSSYKVFHCTMHWHWLSDELTCMYINNTTQFHIAKVNTTQCTCKYVSILMCFSDILFISIYHMYAYCTCNSRRIWKNFIMHMTMKKMCLHLWHVVVIILFFNLSVL